MSINGYSTQWGNITNTNPNQDQIDNLTIQVSQNTVVLEDHETRIGALEGTVAGHEIQIDTLEGTVAGHETRIDTLEGDVVDLSGRVGVTETRITATESVNTSQTTSINSILQRITDITYNAGSDLTTVANRLIIRAALDSTTSAAAQLTLFNQSAEEANKVQFSIFVGPENNAWNSLTDEGDALMLIRNQSGISNTYFGGFTFCTHGGLAYRFSFDPAIPCIFQNSVDLKSNRIFTTGNMASSTFTLSGVDLGTTLTGLQTQITAIDTLLTTDNVGKTQVGRYFDSPFRGQGGGQPVAWWLSSPDVNEVNEAYHADILPTGTSYATGPNSYLRFKSAGTYRMQMAFSITRNYVSTGSAMGFPSPPPYYPDPDFTLPDYGGGGSGSTGSTVAQFTGAVYKLKLTNAVTVAGVATENFPRTIYNLMGQSFTATDGITNSGIDAYVDHDYTLGQTYNFKGLNITSTIGSRPNRFYIDITFTIQSGDPLNLYVHIQGSVPTDLSNPYYFNVNTHTYSITRLS